MALQNKIGKGFAALKVPATVNADTYGPPVDVSEYTGQMVAILNVTAVSGTNPTLDVTLYECATSNGTFTAVDTSTYKFTQITSSNSLQQLSIDQRSCEKFIELYFDVGGTTPVYTVGATLVADDHGH